GERLFLNMYMDAFAPLAHSYGPRPGASAARILVGRVFAEHVFTRPFGPKDRRKVTSLEGEGMPAITDVHAFEPAEALAGDVGARSDDLRTAFTFGLLHTDVNQHVNSLAYPRIFEELVIGKLQAEETRKLQNQAIEIRWRKPFFAGETADVAIRLDRP